MNVQVALIRENNKKEKGSKKEQKSLIFFLQKKTFMNFRFTFLLAEILGQKGKNGESFCL